MKRAAIAALTLTLKKGKPCIAPLQPPTLAFFRTWGGSAGAGRTGLPSANIAVCFLEVLINKKSGIPPLSLQSKKLNKILV